MLTFKSWLVEAAKHPIPPLKDWKRYPTEDEYENWGTGRKKPVRWFRHDLPVPEGERHKLRSGGYNQPRYNIQYNEPNTEFLYGPKGQDAGEKRTGGNYTLTHYTIDPQNDPNERFPQYHKELGHFKNPVEAHRAARAHYSKVPYTPATKEPKRPDTTKLFKPEKVESGEDDFGYLDAKTGRAITSKDADTHGELWAHKTEGKRATGTQAHIQYALNAGHIRYRYAEEDGEVNEADFTIQLSGDSSDKTRMGHIIHMLNQCPYDLKRIVIDIYRRGKLATGREFKSGDLKRDIAAAKVWMDSKV